MINESETARTFEFEDHYVILPEIGGNYGLEYSYIKGKKPVSFESYCSGDSVIGKEGLL